MEISPTDGKVGAGFKGEGRRTAGGVVEVIQAQEEWDRTGAQNEQVAPSARGELTKREALPCTHRTWIDDRLYPANNPVQDLVEGVH